MQINRWQKIEEIFNLAAVLPLAQRRGFIKDTCRDDKELYREILVLIEADAEENCFLDQPNFDLGLKILADGRVGTRVSHYVILKLLGQGGMGEVYLVQDVESGKRVALKLLNETATKDADRVRRFRQEARAASLIKHTNVASVYEIGEVENNQFIAMEYIDGVTLRERLKTGVLTLGEALAIARQIAAALEAAHASGIIHRDLKPENVMIERDNHVKVLDFGLAKLIKPAAFQTSSKNVTAQANLLTHGNSTAFGMVFGTAAYMSPEQARGQKTDERTDIWSFGVLLYEMITGVSPFRGKTNVDVIAAVLTAEPKPLTEIFPDVLLELSNLINQSLQKEPDDRPPNCQMIMSELLRISERLEGDSALTATRPNSVVANDQTLSNPHRTTDDNNRTAEENQNQIISDKKKSQKFFYAFVGVFFIAVLGIAGYFYVIRPNQSPTDTTPANAGQTNIGTSNSEAEREYQTGVYIWNKRKIEDMPQALSHFQKAIELDPGFAKAYVGLANAYQWEGNPNLTRDERHAHVKASLQRALALNPNLAEARATLAFTLGAERDWYGAEREYRKAIEIDPDYAQAHHWYSEFLAAVAGRDDEAVKHINRALELDPLSYAILNDSVIVNYFVGRYDEAIAKAEKMIAFDARYEPRAREWLARLYVYKGDIERAKKEFRLYEKLSGGKISDGERADYYALFGEREMALNYIKKVESSADAVRYSFGLARVYSNLNLPEEAFKWLEIALENNIPSITTIAAEPDLDNLHSDPRFMKLLERLNMAEFWRDKLNKQ